jgi:O-antigen/teichoic acid export membrane protein
MSTPRAAGTDGPDRAALAAAVEGDSVFRGGAWNSASRLIPQLYVLAISVAGARFLGAEAFGRQSFISFVELSVVLLLTGGVSVAAVRFIGDSLGRNEPARIERLIAWAWRVEGLAALVGGGTLAVAAYAGADPRAAWLFAAVACSVGVLHSVPSALLIGMQRWRDASIVGLVTGAIAMAATVAVLAAGGGITGMFAVEAAVAVVNLAWTTVLARRALGRVASRATDRFDRQAWRELRARTWRYALPASYGVLLTLVVWRRSEFFFLERYSTDTQIALYSVVFAVVAALTQFPEVIGAVALPAVATLSGAGEADRIRAGFARGLRLVALVALPTTAAALALGPRLLRLVFGEDFEGTAPVLLIMVAPFPLLPLLSLSRSVLAGLGRLRFQLAAETVAAAVNITLAFALVADHGAVGAAVSNVAAQVTAAVLVLTYALWSVGGVHWRPASLWRGAVAAVGAGVAGWAGVALLDGVAGLAVGALLASIVFAGLAVGLKILPREDAAWLREAAGTRFGGVLATVCDRCS